MRGEGCIKDALVFGELVNDEITENFTEHGSGIKVQVPSFVELEGLRAGSSRWMEISWRVILVGSMS